MKRSAWLGLLWLVACQAADEAPVGGAGGGDEGRSVSECELAAGSAAVADRSPQTCDCERDPGNMPAQAGSGSGAQTQAIECEIDVAENTSDAGIGQADGGPACDCQQAVPEAMDGGAVVQPEFAADGSLLRPADAEQWVFMGSGVNLNYVQGRPGIIVDIVTVTLMEPTAHAYFQANGTFAEGTMTALMGFVLDSGAPPAMNGQYPGDQLLFEMSVKDSDVHGADVWGYYEFGPEGQRATAKPSSECNACHAEHAATDFVFTQFYPFMRGVTP